MSRIALVSVALGLALASPATAQRPARASRARPRPTAAPAAITIPYQRFVLKNGLTLLVHEDHKAPIVATNIWYHVGSKNERPGRTGFAHLFEHMMFQGSPHTGPLTLPLLENAGATDINGSTTQDRTNYYQTVPSEALEYLPWLESDRMGFLPDALTQAKLD